MEADLKFDAVSGSACLKLGGSLTIQHAAELKKVLVEASEGVDSMRLDLDEVAVFDLSSIQLLYACHQAMVGCGRSLQLSGECPTLFREAVERAGFSWVEWLCFGNRG